MNKNFLSSSKWLRIFFFIATILTLIVLSVVLYLVCEHKEKKLLLLDWLYTKYNIRVRYICVHFWSLTLLNQPNTHIPLNQPNTHMQFSQVLWSMLREQPCLSMCIKPPRTYVRCSTSVVCQTWWSPTVVGWRLVLYQQMFCSRESTNYYLKSQVVHALDTGENQISDNIVHVN